MDKKKPDQTEASKKFDLNSIVNTLKSLVTSEVSTPEVSPDDAIGMKIKELSLIMQEMAKLQAQQAKDSTRANQLFNEVFKDIEALRNQYRSVAGPSVSSEVESLTEEKPRTKRTPPPSDKNPPSD